ncbi:hypothetical protein [Gloeothece verrucosa]|uniref:Uncharacterized protein n=1 Tax=Gloeothece verrucosa (strain PCC 7822) TaxID=497965 RepID=E0UAG4_GLOV7|nr:hypothetical protein [Gloeothece verrucosa]ADN12705.1 hypothetical protein Cyan7822_0669 [Gloeothece verrucosa PCC 7822]
MTRFTITEGSDKTYFYLTLSKRNFPLTWEKLILFFCNGFIDDWEVSIENSRARLHYYWLMNDLEPYQGKKDEYTDLPCWAKPFVAPPHNHLPSTLAEIEKQWEQDLDSIPFYF